VSTIGGGVTRAQRLMKYGEPRALPEHRGRDGYAYRQYCRAWLARAGGSLPPEALFTLREAGLVMLDLSRLRGELEALRARRGGGVRKREERRVRAEIRKTRVQQVFLERRLEALAGQNGQSADPLDALARSASRHERRHEDP
jgi:hypothetical protein